MVRALAVKLTWCMRAGGVLQEALRLIGADRNTMAAVHACRCIRAVARGVPLAQERALANSSVEVLVHAASHGSACMCARDACSALHALCASYPPAQQHAYRCGAVDILIKVLRGHGSCAVAAAHALSAVLCDARAAENAMATGALPALLEQLRSAAAAGAWSDEAAEACRAAAAALAALMQGSVPRCEAFVDAGGVETLCGVVSAISRASKHAAPAKASAAAATELQATRAALTPTVRALWHAMIPAQWGQPLSGAKPRLPGPGQSANEPLRAWQVVDATSAQPKIEPLQLISGRATSLDLRAVCSVVSAICGTSIGLQTKLRSTSLLENLVRAHARHRRCVHLLA